MSPDQVRACRNLGATAYHEGRSRMAVQDTALERWLWQEGLVSRAGRTAAYTEFRAGWLMAERVAQSATGWRDGNDGTVIQPDGDVIETTGKVVK